MEIGSSSMYLVAVFIAYFIFVFTSESLNPLSKPKLYIASIRRWRFARRIALMFLVFTWGGLLAANLLQISPLVTVGITTIAFACYWGVKSVKRLSGNNKLFFIPEDKRMNFIQTNANEKTQFVTEAISNSTTGPTMPADRAKTTIDYNYFDKQYSEHKMDVAFADTPPCLANLDQSFADAQLENRQTTERTSEVVRDHALQINNESPIITAMKRKKRRLTEVRANKVVMKLRKRKALLLANEG